VGDIAGMGADLFGSFAEATCAALVISSVSSLGRCFPAEVFTSFIFIPCSSASFYYCQEGSPPG